MGGSSGPAQPDYKGQAEAQAAGSREATTAATWANRPTQTTPWGSIDWTAGTAKDPATGQNVTTWNQNLSLDPKTQSALDAQQNLQDQKTQLASGMFGRVGQEVGQPMDFGKYGEAVGLSTTANQARQGAVDNYMSQFSSRADPRYARAEDAMRTRLLNQGAVEGSEPYKQSMKDFQDQKADAYNQAQYSAVQQGGVEGQRQLGMDTSVADYSNKIRSQGIAEEMTRRGFSLNEINAILSGQQVSTPNMPQFQQSGTAQGVQSLQAAQLQGQGQLDQYNAQQGQNAGMMAGVGTVAGIAAIAL